MRHLKLVCKDAIGTFRNVYLDVNEEDNSVSNLGELPLDMQYQVLSGEFDAELHDFDGKLAI